MSPAKATLTRNDPIEARAPEVIRRLDAAYPDAKVALHFSNALECLIATILSAQCTDEKVNEVTATLFVKYPTAESYLAVPEDELKEDIRPTGFFNQKAISIRTACQRIVEVYGGQVPDTMEDLMTLRGVARKTANIVLGNAFGIVEGIAVDTHVKRLANRIGFSEESDPDKIERDLMRLDPARRMVRVHVRADRPRACDLPGEEAALHRVRDRAAVPREPGVSQTAISSSSEAAVPAATGPADPPAFLLVEAAPDAGVLERVERPPEAFGPDVASRADGLGPFGLLDRRGRGACREEEVGILADAAGARGPPRVPGVVSESRFSHRGSSQRGRHERATSGRQ